MSLVKDECIWENLSKHFSFCRFREVLTSTELHFSSLVSTPLTLGMNPPMRSLTVSHMTTPASSVSQCLTPYIPHQLWLAFSVWGGRGIMLHCWHWYTIYAILTNCCVLFTGYAWSHVMCSAGAISALLFPLVCVLCLCLSLSLYDCWTVVRFLF